MGTILLIVLILVLIGALPTWPYSSGWGYYPSGGVGFDCSHLAYFGSHGPPLGSGGAFSHLESVTDWRMHELGTGKR